MRVRRRPLRKSSALYFVSTIGMIAADALSGEKYHEVDFVGDYRGGKFERGDVRFKRDFAHGGNNERLTAVRFDELCDLFSAAGFKRQNAQASK